MSEYTPTTDQMREWFAEPKSEPEAISPDAHYEATEMFDRWLAEYTAARERAAAEKAWDEAVMKIYANGWVSLDPGVAPIDNPYRLNEGEKQ